MDFINEKEWIKRKKILEEINIYLNILRKKASLKIFKSEQEIKDLENKIKKLIKIKYGTIIEIKLVFKNLEDIKIKKFHIISDNKI